jgi:purine-nucleoside phosphorylase
VLGSGFGGVLRERIDGTTVPYKKIDGMPEPTSPGHAGEAHIGMLHGRRVVAFSGRFHLYEGRAPTTSSIRSPPPRTPARSTIVLTNAAGGVNTDYRARRPDADRRSAQPDRHEPAARRGSAAGPRQRFVDMVDAYAPHLRELARHIAASTRSCCTTASTPA